MPNIPIFEANPTTRVFKINTRITDWFRIGDELLVNGSTGNDGSYTITNVGTDPGNTYTWIEVAPQTPEIFVSNVGNGYLGKVLFDQLAGKSTTSTTFTDKELPEGFYYYIVIAILKNGTYNSSSVVIKTAPEDSTPPSQISNLRAEVSKTQTEVQLSWNDNYEDGIKGYAIYRTITPYGLAMQTRSIDNTGTNTILEVYGNYSDIMQPGETITWRGGANDGREKQIISITDDPINFLCYIVVSKTISTLIDSSGYIEWAFTKWELIETTTATRFTDTKIPKGLDWFTRTTYTAYKILAYDTNYNMGLATDTEIFTITPLENIRCTVDYLDLNIYWDAPKDKDHIEGVIAFLKEKNSNTFYPITACRADERMSILSTNYPITKGKQYDLRLGYQHFWDHNYTTQMGNKKVKIQPIYTPGRDQFILNGTAYLFDCTDPTDNGEYTITNKQTFFADLLELTLKAIPQLTYLQYNNSNGMATILLIGNYAKYYRYGDIIEIANSLFNNSKTVDTAENIEDATIITFTTAWGTGEEGSVFGTIYSARPRAATTGGSIIPLDTTIKQLPNIPISIPDYIEDTIRPATPTNLILTPDPENDRLFVTWDRVAINDDFLRYEVSIYDETTTPRNLTIIGRTTDNNFTINGMKKRVNNNTWEIGTFTSNSVQVRSPEAADTLQYGDLIEVRGTATTTNNDSAIVLSLVKGSTTTTIYTDTVWTATVPPEGQKGYVSTAKNIYIQIIAIDRAGNKSNPIIEKIQWRSYEYNGELNELGLSVYKRDQPPYSVNTTLLTPNYWLPEITSWMWTGKSMYGNSLQDSYAFTQGVTGMPAGRHGPYDNPSVPQKGAAIELRVRMQDNARLAKYFKNYILLAKWTTDGTGNSFSSIYRQFGAAKITPAEVLDISNTNEITMNLEIPKVATGTTYYLMLWVWIEDKFGNYYPGGKSAVRVPEEFYN